MPIYDYQCTACDHRIEVVHGLNESGPAACQLCGGHMKKLFAPPSIVFKGTGWAKKERGASTATKASKAKAADGSSSASDAAPSSSPAAADASTSSGGD